jgi:hypothetical protein
MIRESMGPEGKTGSTATLDGYARLANAIFIQAIIDYVRGDCVDKAEVILWLGSNEAQTMADILDLQVDVFRAVMDRDFSLPYNAVRGDANKFGWRVDENKTRQVKLIRH